MKLSEIYKIADGIAPKKLSDEACLIGFYDNSGILIDTGDEIKKVLFSLDFSFSAIEKAIEEGANLIVTHHPAIYGKLGEIRFDDEHLTGAKVTKCLKNSISVLSMHLNLDFADGGTDESLMDGILSATDSDRTVPTVMTSLSSGGYGRVYDVKPIELNNFEARLKKVFSTDRVLVYGEKEKEIKRVASFCGAGANEKEVLFAMRSGADAIVSSDFKHHVLTMARESGLAVVALTHYASEHYGFKKYYEKISRGVNVPCVYHTDEEWL